MKVYKCLTKTKAAIVWAGVLSGMAGLFVFAQECKEGAVDGILLCLGVLVPSLFPFFILTSFIAESGICECLSPLLNPVSKLLTGLKGICLIPVILSVTGGYPVGARAVAALYTKGDLNKDEAAQLSLICCSAGPGFLVTFVGISLLCSKESGIILLISQIISTVLLCIVSRFFYRNKPEQTAELTKKPVTPKISEVLVSAVNSAVKSSVGMCGFVIAFSVLCNVLTKGLGINGILGKAAVSLLEITTGVNILAGETDLSLLSGFLGFGGICVHLQIFRELKGIEFSKARFYIFRLTGAAVCMLSTKILLTLFPVSTDVFSTVSEKPELTFYSSIVGCCALTLTSALFILSTRKNRLS